METMNDSDVRTEVRGFVVDNYLFGDVEQTPGDDELLLESGVLDSIGVLELIEFLEQRFAIEVEEHETVTENLGSISGLTRFVLEKQD